MPLSKNEFLVLREIVLHPSCAQRKIVEATGLSLGSVNSAAKSLTAAGLIADGEPTEAGTAALAPYRVENAVILAAGLSSRFAPISYEKPKGLLKVRGEVLVERQIEQLLAAGITDITVVVGYKKEYFFYLEDKFGVSIVVNPDYASRNNSSSIKRVEDRLGNTYILLLGRLLRGESLRALRVEGLLRRGIRRGPHGRVVRPDRRPRPHHRRDHRR